MGYTSRKYVDLILKASSKWATLEPFNRKIAPGDYGKIDPETGEFEYHGNIYTNRDILDRIPDLNTADKYKPVVSDKIEKWVITGVSTRQVDGEFSPNVNLGSIAQASINVQFSFKRGARGAFLVMYRPHSIDLPKDVLLHKLHGLSALKGMYLVSNIVTCPAYSLYLSNRDADKVGVAFVGSLPLAVVPGLSGGAGISVGWVSESKSGYYQDAYDIEGEPKYTPLIGLKQMRDPRAWYNRWFRDSPPPPPPEGDELWIDVDETESLWPSLGEEEGEDDFVDYVSG